MQICNKLRSVDRPTIARRGAPRPVGVCINEAAIRSHLNIINGSDCQRGNAGTGGFDAGSETAIETADLSVAVRFGDKTGWLQFPVCP
jgi:hypothetical protein